MHLTAELLKAARALVGWKAADLAKASGVPHDTLRAFESGRTKSMAAANAKAVIEALEGAGVIFVPSNGHGPGVRLRDRQG